MATLHVGSAFMPTWSHDALKLRQLLALLLLRGRR